MVTFRHDEFPNLIVYCIERFARVEVCGAECDYFDGGTEDTRVNVSTEGIEPVAFVANRAEDNLLQVPLLNTNDENYETISRLMAEGYDVDDDNALAPENIPEPAAAVELLISGLTWSPWGSRTICYRQSEGHRFENPRLIGNPASSQCMDYFLFFLPPYVKRVILEETNKAIVGNELAWGKFMRYI